MKRVFTAQEMRELAEMIDHGGAFALTDPSIIEANVAMLRQAADNLEREEKREKKYEYAERYDDGVVSSSHDSEMIDRTLIFDDSDVVRRSVGEWEEVMDGKDKIPDIDSDIKEASIGLGIHITREDIKKCCPDDAVFSNVLVGEWEDGK